MAHESFEDVETELKVFGIVCNENSCSKMFDKVEELMNFKRNK